MNLYECIVILDAGLNDEAIEESTRKFQDLITSGGGELLKTDPWGRRKMGYEINKHKRGFYLLLIFRAPADLIAKMEGTFKVYDPVVKYMVIKLEKKQAAGTLKAIEDEKNAPAKEEAPAEAAPVQSAEAPAGDSGETSEEAPKEE